MKKYLMTGVAALAMCAAFTSCSHDTTPMTQEEINQFEAQKIVNTYNQAFIATFGQPAANQDWGFGSSSTRTRGVFANGNEWAANDRTDCMYKVPPVLTPEQKAVVIKYFQTVKNPTYQDPQWTDYFIQQVYKGGTTPGANSTEKYKAADGTTDIIGSDHMDHLAAIDNTRNPEFVDHNNNFNHGDCGVYGNVLNYKGTLTTVEETYPVNSGDEYRHADKINLMTNSTTKSFGYYNSNSSVRRTEYTGLVNFQTIIDKLGAEANCLNDGWNRSFMGFDFEMMIGGDLYQKSGDEIRYVKISDIPGNAPQYIWDGENVIKWFDYDESWNKVYAEGYDEFVKINGQKIPYLITNTNMYAGNRLDAQTTLENITQSNLKVKKDYSNDVKNVECLNLPLIKAAFEAGYYPTKDSAQDWVKVGGTADGYYSDWIVTLTKAEKYDTPPTKVADLRIMAEDLSAQEASDFDFNDIVFDVFFAKEGETQTKILVRAAGGTLPLRIKVSDTEWQEVHGLWGLGTGIMINTGAEAMFGSSKGADNKGSKELTLKYAVKDAAAAKNITIQVEKTLANGQTKWMDMTAETGEPAAKFAIPAPNPDAENWCRERTAIQSQYKKFTDWVAGQTNIQWWLGTE